MMGSSVEDIFRKIISNIEYRSIEATQTEMQGEEYNKNNNNKQTKQNRTSKNCETISKM